LGNPSRPANFTFDRNRCRSRNSIGRSTPQRVTVTGVGFVDFLHDARGQAPNGFELHPVVSVVIDAMTSPPHR